MLQLQAITDIYFKLKSGLKSGGVVDLGLKTWGSWVLKVQQMGTPSI